MTRERRVLAFHRVTSSHTPCFRESFDNCALAGRYGNMAAMLGRCLRFVVGACSSALLLMAACGSDGDSDDTSERCAKVCGCVAKELGSSAEDQCKAECKEVERISYAIEHKYECEARLDANGAGVCKNTCEVFALDGPPWSGCDSFSATLCSCAQGGGTEPCNEQSVSQGICCSHPQTGPDNAYGCYCRRYACASTSLGCHCGASVEGTGTDCDGEICCRSIDTGFCSCGEYACLPDQEQVDSCGRDSVTCSEGGTRVTDCLAVPAP
jgi:hypothetical protein